MSAAECVVFFDGVCHLCNGAVRWIFQRDPHGRIRFAQLQSPAGINVLTAHGLDAVDYDSFLFLENGTLHTHSAAALRVARLLRFPWNVLSVLWLVPRPLRDAVYNWVARNRYRWFGREETCMLPTAELQRRFIEGGVADG